jgi:undecaprenyl phosphate N,N'-diacetylbacillosamine 1-phosphate transferase
MSARYSLNAGYNQPAQLVYHRGSVFHEGRELKHGWQVRIKHALDRLIAFVLLVALCPLLLLVALVIRLGDRGPAIFRQERVGESGRIFRIWKFRTMAQDADRLLDAQGRVKSAGRITRVGALLRATSLDELPQLVNILRGEMSFVGPRPVLPEHYARCTVEQRGRCAMRPGVTGLAQVSGRNTLAWSKRIQFDLDYVRCYSLWLDVVILARTVIVVATGRGMVLDRNPEQVDDLDGSSPGRRR